MKESIKLYIDRDLNRFVEEQSIDASTLLENAIRAILKEQQTNGSRIQQLIEKLPDVEIPEKTSDPKLSYLMERYLKD